MPVLITAEIDECRPQLDVNAVQNAAQSLLDLCGCRDKELSVLLTCDTAIADLNRQYRKKQGPTNVLAFPMLDETDTFATHLLGDIVISVETAGKEAEQENIGVFTRIVFLLIHGLLHLLGYDHERSDADADAMETEQKRVLALFNQQMSVMN